MSPFHRNERCASKPTASDDDKNFADGMKVTPRIIAWMMAIGLVIYAVYSCGETLTAEQNYIYYGWPSAQGKSQ